MDTVHTNTDDDRNTDDDQTVVHREVFEVLKKLDLGEVSLSTLQMMKRRLTKTLNNMHDQVHECRKELGLPEHSLPEKKYRHPREARNSKKRKVRSRRYAIPSYALPGDPAVQKQKIKAAIWQYQRLLRRVRSAIEAKERGRAKAPDTTTSAQA